MTMSQSVSSEVADAIFRLVVEGFDRANEHAEGAHYLARLVVLLGVQVGCSETVGRLSDLAQVSTTGT